MASDEEIIYKLVKTPEARIAAFNLQALGKLYIPYDALFAKMQSDFKQIEDGIGQVSKWQDLQNPGGF